MRLLCSWRDAAGNSVPRPKASQCESISLASESGEDLATLTRFALFMATAEASAREALERLLTPQKTTQEKPQCHDTTESDEAGSAQAAKPDSGNN